MSETKLGIADYPLAENRPEIVRGKRGKGLDEITLDRSDRGPGDARRSQHHERRPSAAGRDRAGRRPADAGPELRAGRRARRRAARHDHAHVRAFAPGACAIQGRAAGSGKATSRQGTARPRWLPSLPRPPRSTSGADSSRTGSDGDGMSWKTGYRSIYYTGHPSPMIQPHIRAHRAARHRRPEHLPRPARPGVTAARRAAPVRRLDPFSRSHAEDRACRARRSCSGLFRQERASSACSPASPAIRRTAATARCQQKMPGWNNLLLPEGRAALADRAGTRAGGDEIVVTKTTDSALTGTNLRLILPNIGIRTWSAAASSPTSASRRRSAASPTRASTWWWSRTAAPPRPDELHHKELEIINMIYCHVMSSGRTEGDDGPELTRGGQVSLFAGQIGNGNSDIEL